MTAHSVRCAHGSVADFRETRHADGQRGVVFGGRGRLELRSLLLGGGHQWDANAPATEDAIAALVSASPVPLPSEYLALLRLSDGGAASLSGYPGYVRIWAARTAVEHNRDYEVERWLPGFVGFGDNGGPDMVGFDTRSGKPYRVCAIPFAPMEWEAAMGNVTDFSTFIQQLLPSENKHAEPCAEPDRSGC